MITLLLLTVMTFNIHHGEGRDGQLSLQRIAAVIESADIVALQEVDRHWSERSNLVDQAEWLAGKLNRYYVFAPNLDLDGSTSEEGRIKNSRRQYGVALLSRYPIQFSRSYPLPKLGAGGQNPEQRGLLECQVVIPEFGLSRDQAKGTRAAARLLRVYVTHLSHASMAERLLQVQRIREILERAQLTGSPYVGVDMADSWVLLGDFNFKPDSDEYTLLAGASDSLAKDTWKITGESEGHTINLGTEKGARIDYIFVSSDLAPSVRSARVLHETNASDHQPVAATLNY
ncbi:MAG: endonuclease/exonuclease/phosphatase family protein [Acidobacteriota bacterium]